MTGMGAPVGDPQGQPTQAPAQATAQQAPAGKEAQSKVQVALALDLMTTALAGFAPGTEEHKVLLDTIKRLSKQFSASGASAQSSAATMAQGGGAQPPQDAAPQAGGDAGLSMADTSQQE